MYRLHIYLDEKGILNAPFLLIVAFYPWCAAGIVYCRPFARFFSADFERTRGRRAACDRVVHKLADRESEI
jgi:hypothetical protein